MITIPFEVSMKRWELISAIVGLMGGALFGGVVVWLFMEEPAIWLGSLTGAIAGLAGGGVGQNFLEGVVAAVISLIGVAMILSAPFPGFLWWCQESLVGYMLGGGIGYLTHGSIGLFFK